MKSKRESEHFKSIRSEFTFKCSKTNMAAFDAKNKEKEEAKAKKEDLKNEKDKKTKENVEQELVN